MDNGSTSCLPANAPNKDCASMWGQMDYKQQDIGDYVGEVLELLERTGGKNAFQHIKMMVPLCECDTSTQG